MTNYVASITFDEVVDALSPFIKLFINGGEVVRAQENRVSMPRSPFAVITEVNQVDINISSSQQSLTSETSTISSPKRVDIQIDFYGKYAGDYSSAFKTAFRSEWGINQFPAGFKPLYVSDGHQAPLITGEQQYESRWTVTATMQYNPTVTVPQQSANIVSITSLNKADN